MIRNTAVCDGCGTQYMLEPEQDLPPYWFAIQIVICDGDGVIPAHERDQYLHFCCQECLTNFSAGEKLRERVAMVDRKPESGPEEEGENDVN